MSKSLFKSVQNESGSRIESSVEDTFNLTHLSPAKELARFRFQHRDFLAHSFRYAYTAKILHSEFKPDYCTILDIGCGPDWSQLVAIHSNGCHPGYYLGVDARDCSKTLPKVNFPAVFEQLNVVEDLPKIDTQTDWDLVICYEVLEHMSRDAGLEFLKKIHSVMGPHTLLLFSTPCYNGTMAESHLYEWGYAELKAELETKFIIEDHFGTFASIKDYLPLMTPEEKAMYERLKKYYNSALISCMMAPLYPHKARNVLWRLTKKIDTP